MARKQPSPQKKYDIFSVLSFVFGLIPIITHLLMTLIWSSIMYNYPLNVQVLSITQPVYFVSTILAIVFGFIGQKRVKQYGYKGKRFYLAGLILAFIAIIIFLISFWIGLEVMNRQIE